MFLTGAWSSCPALPSGISLQSCSGRAGLTLAATLSQLVVVALGVLVVSACKPFATPTPAETDTARRYAGQVKGGETYPQYDSRRDSYAGSRGSFAGAGCTEDCSGHEAGYAWAEEKGITDPDNCGGKSWSFVEGCRAYAEEQSGEDREEPEQED